MLHGRCKFVPETLYLCVNIIDRYCNIAKVQKTKLQLIGVTALMLASKYEEIKTLPVKEWVLITDGANDLQEVLFMESTILTVLKWKLSLPTAYFFLHRFLRLTKATDEQSKTAACILERTLGEHDLLKYRPSMVCASAVILALNNPAIHLADEYPFWGLPGFVSSGNPEMVSLSGNSLQMLS